MSGTYISSWWFQIFFNLHPYLGMISNLTNIFQMGWNHQLDLHGVNCNSKCNTLAGAKGKERFFWSVLWYLKNPEP